MSAWIGVDLDGTLAHYDGWRGPTHIGDPVPLMLERVKGWLAEGREVRIFTARVSVPEQEAACRAAIETWCLKHLGIGLPVTCSKDYGMVELWDDRCKQVLPNTGAALEDVLKEVGNVVMGGYGQLPPNDRPGGEE